MPSGTPIEDKRKACEAFIKSVEEGHVTKGGKPGDPPELIQALRLFGLAVGKQNLSVSKLKDLFAKQSKETQQVFIDKAVEEIEFLNGTDITVEL